MKKVTVTPVGRESDKFMLRFPDNMRSRITAIAKQNGRSMNAEIIHRLALSLEANDFCEAPNPETGETPVQPVAKSWAEYMALPENQKDLEAMLTVVRMILQRFDEKKNE